MRFPLAGNGGVKKAVSVAIENKRLPHAIIIEGEHSSGKTTLSMFIAAALLCKEQISPCGKCKSCTLVKAFTHPDLFITALEDKKKNISVEQIRKLRNEAYIRPQMSDSKVFIIDCADTMNPQSQNAILKVLEEPPGNTVFILQVRSRSALLPTILSRCVTYTLSEPSEREAVDFLVENNGIDANQAKILLSENGNQMGAVLAASKNKSSQAYKMATDYLEAAQSGTLYELIAITAPLEKERVKAGEFFAALSFLLLGRIKKAALSGKSAKKDFIMLEFCKEAQESLKNNVNLSLLFCVTASNFKIK